MILPAQSIRAANVVAPFFERGVQNGLSFGLGPAGYDIRIAESFWLWPGRFVLGSTIERFNMPADVLGKVCDKSTWARRGLCIQNTVIEPGWRGFLTLELTNHAMRVIRIMSGDPIAQIVFHRLEGATEQPYSGKYQNQKQGAQPAIKERAR